MRNNRGKGRRRLYNTRYYFTHRGAYTRKGAFVKGSIILNRGIRQNKTGLMRHMDEYMNTGGIRAIIRHLAGHYNSKRDIGYFIDRYYK